MFDEHDLRNQTTLEEMTKFNVSVLVYPFHKAVHDGLRDVMFEDSLLRDEKEMNKYQEWRKLYTYERAGVEIACELCKKLEQLKIDKWRGKPVKPTIVDNMASHFKSMANCGP
ncbi:uncharacterized protein LOC142340054 isoform X2 [Convolutriloba macropyga]